MTITERLKAEIERSDKFTHENYGLKVGDGFPDLCREVLREDQVAMKLFQHFMIQTLSANKMAAKLTPGDPNTLKVMAQQPEVNELPMSMLYWGIEIGRAMEREYATSAAAKGGA